MQQLLSRLAISPEEKKRALGRLGLIPAPMPKENKVRLMPDRLDHIIRRAQKVQTDGDRELFLRQHRITPELIEEYAIKQDSHGNLLLPEMGDEGIGTVHVRSWSGSSRVYRLFSGSSAVMHQELLPSSNARIVMIEDPWDAVSWQHAIIEAEIDDAVVVPLYGLFFTQRLLDLLWSRRRRGISDKILLAANRDARGIYGVHKLVRRLTSHCFPSISIPYYERWKAKTPAAHSDNELLQMLKGQQVSSPEEAQWILMRYFQP